MATKALIQQLWEILEPAVASEGMELVEVEFQREPRGWVLRLYIDRDGGVTLEDCTVISREVGDLLDVKDLIDHPYHLEVSSPGLERPLRRPSDFERFAGERVRIYLTAPSAGKRVAKGVLLGSEGDLLRLDTDQGIMEIPLGDVAKARLIYSWLPESSQGARRGCNSI